MRRVLHGMLWLWLVVVISAAVYASGVFHFVSCHNGECISLGRGASR